MARPAALRLTIVTMGCLLCAATEPRALADAGDGRGFTLRPVAVGTAPALRGSAVAAVTQADPAAEDVIFLPDLFILLCSASCDPGTGLLDVTLDVCNDGGVAASAFEVGVYASADATITTADLFLGSGQADFLAVGTCITFVGSLDISTLIPATYSVGGYADDLFQVIEINENDNTCVEAPAALPCCLDPKLGASPVSLVVDCHGTPLAAPGSESIRLNSASIQTTPMTAAALASTAPSRVAHRLLHFDHQPGMQEKRALEALGATILGYAPDHAVLVSVPPGFVPPDGLAVDWVAAIKPQWKLARSLRAALDDGRHDVIHGVVVEFFRDVPPAQSQSLLAALEVRALPNDFLPGHMAVVRATVGEIDLLARADSVARIVPASTAILDNQPTRWCAGPSTLFGPVLSFSVINDGWDGPGQGSALDLTYHFQNVTVDVPGSAAIAEILRALNEWALHAALAFAQASGPDQSRSFDILFGSGEHGDGIPFDGVGGTLAHTFLPVPDNSEPIAGDMHFDESEFWQIGADIDLFTVTLHEAGHALGLGHSDDPGAVMYAFYGGPVSSLAPDDIAGIQSIYAATGGSGGECLTLSNIGCAALTISSIAAPTWAVLSPAPPFTIPPGGSQRVCVDACAACAGADLTDTLVVSSDDPAMPTLLVPLTVDCNDPPIADAGPDQTIADADGDGVETVTLDGTGSADADGTIVNYFWTEGAAVLADTATATTTIVLPVGVHPVALRVTDGDGTTATDTVVITIDGTCTSPATRTLPAMYAPGTAATVQISITPAPNTLNWAVEETPPPGWTVTAVSNGGSFAGGVVKWGPFVGDTPVVLGYDAAPPIDESGSRCFTGLVSADGVSRPVCGDDCVDGCPCHPADADCDFSLTIDEATAYGACWLSGCAWPIAPSPPDIDFATRAGFLWQSGELYCCDPSQPAPALWVSAVPTCPTAPAVIGASAAPSTAAVLGTAQREFHLLGEGDDVVLRVQITVTPDAGASTFAVEETIADGVTLGAISDGGRFDATAEPGTVRLRWGPFADGEPRVLTYEILGPDLRAAMTSAAGRLSVDGVSLPIADQGILVAQLGDFDGDHDLDLADFLAFVHCFTEPAASAPAACRVFDFNADGLLELADLVAFQAHFTGPR